MTTTVQIRAEDFNRMLPVCPTQAGLEWSIERGVLTLRHGRATARQTVTASGPDGTWTCPAYPLIQQFRSIRFTGPVSVRLDADGISITSPTNRRTVVVPARSK